MFNLELILHPWTPEGDVSEKVAKFGCYQSLEAAEKALNVAIASGHYASGKIQAYFGYKGYAGKVLEFDERTGLYLGQVLGVKEAITFEAPTLYDAHNAFQWAVERNLPNRSPVLD